jgi:hypothetical protein
MKKQERKITSQQLGIAGEYYVAAELTKRGLIASITLRNSEGVDIICTKQDLSKTYSIQVKTSSGEIPSWIVNSKVESHIEKNFFYVFVLLNENLDSNKYFIVPSKDVAKSVKSIHTKWLSGRKKSGEMRKDTTMRKFYDNDRKYEDKWELLLK